MNRLFRLYNQNRLTFWIVVLIIASIIILIQVLNGFAKEESQKKASQLANLSEQDIEKNVTYNKESKPIIEGDNISITEIEINKSIINNFIDYCKNGEVEKAYNLLSPTCKELFYKTLQDFKDGFIKENIFTGMKYEYALLDSSKYNIYRIKIYEDMLSTGKLANSFKENIFTIVYDNNKALLNINGFINREKIYKTIMKNNVTIIVNYLDLYNDSYVYNITINNKSENDIILDTRTKTNTVFVENTYGTKVPALLYENFGNELKCEKNKNKTLSIKFNISYREDFIIKKIVFSDVVLNISNPQIKEEYLVEL